MVIGDCLMELCASDHHNPIPSCYTQAPVGGCEKRQQIYQSRLIADTAMHTCLGTYLSSVLVKMAAIRQNIVTNRCTDYI